MFIIKRNKISLNNKPLRYEQHPLKIQQLIKKLIQHKKHTQAIHESHTENFHNETLLSFVFNKTQLE